MKLDKFTRAYLECALWSSVDDDGEPLDGLYSIDDLSDSAIATAIEDCSDFQQANGGLLDLAGDDAQNGHDFWLTRNSHGAGFWDRGYGEIGTKLTDASHPYGSVNLYVGDDGMIHAQ